MKLDRLSDGNMRTFGGGKLKDNPTIFGIGKNLSLVKLSVNWKFMKLILLFFFTIQIPIFGQKIFESVNSSDYKASIFNDKIILFNKYDSSYKTIYLNGNLDSNLSYYKIKNTELIFFIREDFEFLALFNYKYGCLDTLANDNYKYSNFKMSFNSKQVIYSYTFTYKIMTLEDTSKIRHQVTFHKFYIKTSETKNTERYLLEIPNIYNSIKFKKNYLIIKSEKKRIKHYYKNLYKI